MAPYFDSSKLPELYKKHYSALAVMGEPRRELDILRVELEEKVEKLESILAENKQQSVITSKNINFLVSENRQFNERAKILETESRLQQLEFKDKTRQLEDQISELRQDLLQINNSGLRILPSRIVVTGEAKLVEYEKLGYVIEGELPPESPKNSVIDETWELPDGRIMGVGDKIVASIKKNGSIEMRGNPDTLNDVKRELVTYGVNLEKIEQGKRYLLKKKQF
jgi:hypothetical protein